MKTTEDFEKNTGNLPGNQPQEGNSPQKGAITKLILAGVLVVALVCAVLFNEDFMPASTVRASENLMAGVTANAAKGDTAISKEFISSTADFSVALFKKSVAQNANSLVSPASVYLALGMTANGAQTNTLKQFQQVLGGGLSIAQLNQNYYNMANRLTSIKDGKLQIANSVWYRNKNLEIKKSFLQDNANYYGAGAFQLDFSKADSADKINSWVKEHTGGKIDKMVDKIDDSVIMYLMNTLYFEADWLDGYQTSTKGSFSTASGTVTADFMSSSEKYIHDGGSEGMLKNFKDTRYAFAAFMPKGGVSMKDYFDNMSGAGFLNLMNSAGHETADCTLPKFKYDYKVDLNDPLKAMGLTDGFDSGLADFSKMGTASNGKIFIGDVLHKTFIQVDEAGAKAGAATKVEMRANSSYNPGKRQKVDFNRPFYYAIIDTETKLPIFIGTVADPTK